MTTLFEQLGGTYSMAGEYIIPNLYAPAGEYPIGKYGRMRLAHLKRHRRVLYVNLLTSGTLYEHLWEVEQRCTAQIKQLVAAYA
ncbi:TnpV protein, partial [Ruminococcaceae bacterium OttesenSCG-928-I18]|nr:TnpV protein [Ruminococcaceae bacterium OttesenSCG-928-I18]